MSEEPILTSLRLYDELRLNATNVTRTEGTNVDIFTMPDGEEIALYHLAGILPFTTGDYKPSQGTFEDGATIALAANHLNIGDGSLVPEVRGLNERCKVRFTAEFKDTEYSPGVALSHVVDYTSRDPGSPERLPGAFIGAVRSAVSMPTSLVTGLLGYPQISAKSTSADLDDSSQFPLFARTIPSDHGSAVPIIIYLSKILKIKHLSVINVNDSYGNAYVQGMRLAANIYAPDMIFHQIPLDDGQSAIEAAVASLKSVGYNFVFAVVFTIPTHDALITEAYNQGVAGDGKHNWLFGDSFGSILSHRTFEKGSPLHSSYRGVGLLEVSGGLPEIVPAYDNFVSQMTDLRNHPKDMEYLGSLWPKHDHPDYGEDPPFIDSEVFLNGNLVNGFAPFMYEAVISLGLSACQASNDNLAFNGQDQFELLKQTRFEGISGTVIFDKTTGTRDPNSALYQVANFIEEETADGLVEFKPQTTDYFLNGNWSYIQDYIFNDGTSNLPPDLPPTEATDQINLGLAIGLPIAALVILGVLIHQLYASKRKENDSVWKVNREDLKFAVPPEIIGRGSFGVVLMAEYRGTLVAIKKVLPPKQPRRLNKKMPGMGSDSIPGIFELTSGSTSDTISTGKVSVSGIGISGNGFKSMTAKKPQSHKQLKQEFIEEMRYLSKIRHPCITTVMGGVLGKSEDPMLVMEYMDHGSLYDILHNETMVMESELLLPILGDISQGVRFLHSANPQVIHGDLKAQNVLVDSRFRAKVADFGLSQKKNLGGTGTPFWMAPELLRGESSNTGATDVYSFGVILYEAYSRKDPYDGEDAQEVMRLVADKMVQKRPPAPSSMPEKIKSIMSDCIDEDPANRPTFEEIDIRLKRVAAEAPVDPNQTNRKSTTISLFDIFPHHIAEALRDGRAVEAEHKEVVTIFFCDIVGFTTISSELDPRKVAGMLDRLYTKFDELSREHDIFKVETIGDAYMAVTNLVKDQHDDHAKRIADFAIDAIQAANSTYIELEDREKGFVNIRVGFHSGSVVADVVGTRNPRYCLFGDTVNTSSRMESNSKVNRIHCSGDAAEFLKRQCPEMPLKCRGVIPIKGKGDMLTFWVNESEPVRVAPVQHKNAFDLVMASLENEGSRESLMDDLSSDIRPSSKSPRNSVSDSDNKSSTVGFFNKVATERRRSSAEAAKRRSTGRKSILSKFSVKWASGDIEEQRAL